MSEPVTDEEVNAYGWNTPEHENPLLNQRVAAEQLNLIGRLLLEIRDALKEDAN